MIVHNFYLEGIAVFPQETNPVLIVDADTELSLPVGPEGFQVVAWRNSKVIQTYRRVK
jgi:hypothetical protein